MKILKWIFGLLLFLLLFCLITGGIVAVKVYDSVPMPLDHSYLRRPKEKEPFIPFYVMQKAQNNYDIMKHSVPETVSSIQYEDDEFNYILRTVLYSNLLNQAGATGGKRISAKRTSFILKDGAFHLKYVVETPQSPFGKYINLHVIFKISVKDGKENLQILSATAGSFRIPDFIVQKMVKEFLQKYYEGTSGQEIVRHSIIDLHMDREGISMKYHPYHLKRRLKKVSGTSTGTFLGMMGYKDEK